MPTSDTGPKQPNATANKTESINPSINPSEPLPTTTVHLTDGAGGVANALKSGKIKADEVISFMMDPAKRNNPNGFRSFATIRESEMRLLKAMLGQEEYDVDFATSFSLGEYVRIAGFDTYNDLAQIVELPGDKSSYVGVRVGFLGCAFMKVPVGRIIKVQS